MSTLFVDETAARERTQLLAATPTDYSALEPGAFEGLASGLGQGLSRAAAATYAVGTKLQRYTGPGLYVQAWDAITGDDLVEQSVAPNEDLARRWINASRMDPVTHGSVSNVLYGITAQAPAIIATALGGPVAGGVVAGATTFEGSVVDLRAAGVDGAAAYEGAAIDASFAALGALLPGAIGGKVSLNTLLTGPGINVAQDIASRYAVAASLENRGYGELATQYRHLDATTLIADAIIGGTFGHLGAKFNRREIDAALVQQRVRAAALNTLGAPVDAVSQAKHSAALAKAQEDLLSGRPVDVTGIEGARFLHEPENALVRVLAQNGYHADVAAIRAMESELAARDAIIPDDAPLPDVPKPRVRAAEDGTLREASTPETVREVATVEAAQAVAPDARIALPDGEVTARVALARADREIETATADSVQFEAAVACAMRYGT